MTIETCKFTIVDNFNIAPSATYRTSGERKAIKDTENLKFILNVT